MSEEISADHQHLDTAPPKEQSEDEKFLNTVNGILDKERQEGLEDVETSFCARLGGDNEPALLITRHRKQGGKGHEYRLYTGPNSKAIAHREGTCKDGYLFDGGTNIKSFSLQTDPESRISVRLPGKNGYRMDPSDRSRSFSPSLVVSDQVPKEIYGKPLTADRAVPLVQVSIIPQSYKLHGPT